MEDSPFPQQSNVTAYGATTLAIITLEVFAGTWINAFIVCVLCIAWVISMIYPNYLYVYSILQLVASFASFSNYSNLWVSACLSGFYCIKIANFRNSFFIYLKVKVDRMVPWLLLGSEIVALAMGIVVYDLMETNITSTSQENFWEVPVRKDKHLFSSFFLIGFGYAASFLAVIFSAVFLLFSLWRHKRTMQTSSMKDLSMDAHIRAMKSVLSFLVMYSINFVCLVLTIIYAMKKENVMTLLIYIYLYAFPGVHSLTVIFSNPKLEKALLKILSYVKWEVFFK
ncbi:taste receptor type 2 member 9-like [Zonotrichia albicollis]|uniref:taste receptor type 2 member 9-like n=1 Tax=Zonotrichia albicollis TaxID=44394 RepID=UPI003D80EB38